MFKWIYDLISGEFLYGGPFDGPYDPSTQGVVKLPRNPNVRMERYDGAAGIRPASAQEISNYDASRLATTAGDRADDLALRGLAAYMVQELNVIRAALPVPLAPVTVQMAKTFIMNFIKIRL